MAVKLEQSSWSATPSHRGHATMSFRQENPGRHESSNDAHEVYQPIQDVLRQGVQRYKICIVANL